MGQRNMAEYKMAAMLGVSESVVRRMLGKRDGGVRINSFFAITDFLGMDRYFVEKEIIAWKDQSCGWRPFTGKFPFELTPLAFRIVAHLIGDGNPSKGSFYQKNKHIHYMVDLIEKVLNMRVNYYEDYKGVCELCVPNFIIQCVSAKLDTQQSKIKSKTFFDKIRLLSKDYKVQTVAAFFVDEGSIKTRRIRFVQKDPEILEGLALVLNSLGYPHTGLRPAKTKLKGKEFGYYYLDLHPDGAGVFFHDVNELVKRYGIMAGLWQKHHAVGKYIQNVNVGISLKRRETKGIQKTLIEKFRRHVFSISGLSSQFGISYSRAADIFRSLKNKEKAKRVGMGLYQIT